MLKLDPCVVWHVIKWIWFILYLCDHSGGSFHLHYSWYICKFIHDQWISLTIKISKFVLTISELIKTVISESILKWRIKKINYYYSWDFWKMIAKLNFLKLFFISLRHSSSQSERKCIFFCFCFEVLLVTTLKTNHTNHLVLKFGRSNLRCTTWHWHNLFIVWTTPSHSFYRT